MNNLIRIRKFKVEDTKESADLIRKTFKRFNRIEGSKKGINSFLDFYDFKKNPSLLKKNFSRTTIFLVALHSGKIVGLIRGSKDRVINLFVDEKFQNVGIGKKLMECFEKEAFSSSNEIKVRSSMYAIEFYQKNGFKKTTGIRKRKGIKIQPMKKTIKK